MNRNDTNPQAQSRYDLVDIISIERQARALQAQAMGDMTRAAWRWIAARVRRAPAGQTA